MKHTVCKGKEDLMEKLDAMVKKGGEGIMIREPGSKYAHKRSSTLLKLKKFHDAEAEIIEAQVLSTSPLSGQRIKDIDFPEGVLVGGVLKEGKLVMPTGSLRFDEGDEIALFVVSKDIPEVERLLQVSIDFF